eukprot:2486330-Ditylum_brightwellii.AAC.1
MRDHPPLVQVIPQEEEDSIVVLSDQAELIKWHYILQHLHLLQIEAHGYNRFHVIETGRHMATKAHTLYIWFHDQETMEGEVFTLLVPQNPTYE